MRYDNPHAKKNALKSVGLNYNWFVIILIFSLEENIQQRWLNEVSQFGTIMGEINLPWSEHIVPINEIFLELYCILDYSGKPIQQQQSFEFFESFNIMYHPKLMKQSEYVINNYFYCTSCLIRVFFLKRFTVLFEKKILYFLIFLLILFFFTFFFPRNLKKCKKFLVTILRGF